MTEPVIRPVVDADLADLRQLLVETWHATYDAIYGADRVAEITGRWHSLEALAEGLQRSNSADLVAASKDGLLGTAGYSWAAGTAKLHRLYVRPAAQGRGIGGRLLDHVIDDLRRLPAIAAISLEVEPRNTGAIDFYRRHGFMDNGRTGDCGGSGDRIQALILQRSLVVNG